MQKFAKLFDTKKLGQILVTLDKELKDEHSVSFRLQDRSGRNLKTTVSFGTGNEGELKAKGCFDRMDESLAVYLAEQFITDSQPEDSPKANNLKLVWEQ